MSEAGGVSLTKRKNSRFVESKGLGAGGFAGPGKKGGKLKRGGN